jgi:hypothetical protein
VDKINALSMGEKLVVAGGVLLLIASFLPWYKYDFGLEGIADISISRNGWQSPGALWGLIAVLVGAAMAGSIIAAKFANVTLPALSNSLTWGTLYLAGGGIVALCIVLKLINESSYISFGFYLGIIAAIALVAGGYLLYSEEKKGVVSP